MCRLFPKLSKNRIWGIFAFSTDCTNVIKDKSWTFCFNLTSRSKVIVLSFLVKLPVILCFIYHTKMVYLLKKESCSNSNFNFGDDVIFLLHYRFRERSIVMYFLYNVLFNIVRLRQWLVGPTWPNRMFTCTPLTVTSLHLKMLTTLKDMTCLLAREYFYQTLCVRSAINKHFVFLCILLCTLLYNRCPVDPTFSISRYGNGQKLSFHSFAFVHDHDAKLYLHCDIIACLPQSTCGVCNNGGRKGGSSGGRKKRNVPFKKIRRLDANALLTRA